MSLQEGGRSWSAFPKAELEADFGCRQCLKVIAGGRRRKGSRGKRQAKKKNGELPELGPCGPLGHLLKKSSERST